MVQTSTDHSALVVVKPSNFASKDRKDSLFCDYCETPMHTRETCFKLHGKPRRGRGRGNPPRSHGGGRGFSVYMTESASFAVSHIPTTPSTDPTTSSLSLQEMASLRQIMNRIDASSASNSSHFAYSGISPSTVISCSWIIVSGASKHMTGSVDLFNTYQYSLSKATVRVFDGSLAPIHGTWLPDR